MTLEEIRVITIVYVSALAPLIIYFYKKDEIPLWVPSIYLGSFLVCSLGWELWFTYGWVDGVAVDLRRSESLNNWLPRDINWLMNSLGDAGAVLLGGFWIIWMLNKRDDQVFYTWSWSAFGILMVWCVGQNILVEMFLYHDQLAEGKPLSWAPLSPLGPYFNPVLFEFNDRTLMLQSQLPWLILPAMVYLIVLKINKNTN